MALVVVYGVTWPFGFALVLWSAYGTYWGMLDDQYVLTYLALAYQLLDGYWVWCYWSWYEYNRGYVSKEEKAENEEKAIADY